MASKQIILDPTALIRLGPVVGSSLAAMYSFDQYRFLRIFLDPAVGQERSNQILPSWFDVFFRRDLKLVIGLNTFASTTALANLLRTDGILAESPARQWYWLGFGFTVAHYLFVPFIMFPVRDIVENRSKGEATKDLTKWLKVHLIRTLIVDLPALACFVAGTASLLAAASPNADRLSF